MIDRRELLLGTAAALALSRFSWVSSAQATQTLKVASVKFGSLSWLLDTVRDKQIDKANSLQLDTLEVATNQAGPIALLAGGAEIIVSDWTWAMRQRGMGVKLKFAPFSSALGAIMVPAGGKVEKFEDLAGKKLGVAGSSIDKSWLLLRGYSRKTLGKDIADITTPTFGTAPLLSEELRSGRLDGVLNFWTYAARLSSEGYVELLRMDSVLKDLGVSPVPPMVGFVWKEETEKVKGPAIAAFLKSMQQGNQILQQSDEAWERLRPLIKPTSDGELNSIAQFYRSGIPTPWGRPETEAAQKLMSVLIDVGDQELVGHGTQFDAELFHVTS
ncbi:MAG: ABC transporter substrate-binding protein [Hyphomicrobiaceae bacterium]|nr:ABC transporter substrate-binding protein [Hyphomicrobiaceae bacterium]